MLPAQTIEKFRCLLERRALSSLYLDTGYNKDATQTLIEFKQIFDDHVGKAWDVIFPCTVYQSSADGYLPSDHFNATDFNSELSRKLLRTFNIRGEECPAIVFFGYDESDYFVYPLRKLGGDWRQHFYEIGEIALRTTGESQHMSNTDLKYKTMREVRNYLRPRFRFENVGRVGGIFAQVVGATSSTISILK